MRRTRSRGRRRSLRLCRPWCSPRRAAITPPRSRLRVFTTPWWSVAIFTPGAIAASTLMTTLQARTSIFRRNCLLTRSFFAGPSGLCARSFTGTRAPTTMARKSTPFACSAMGERNAALQSGCSSTRRLSPQGCQCGSARTTSAGGGASAPSATPSTMRVQRLRRG